MTESRVKKSLRNAKVNLLFYFITLVLSFISRKVFLDYLGADFIGLIGTLQNLIGFLNLAELGISTAIGYVLYKPLFSNNHKDITEIVSLFGYLYRKIGFIIIVGGIVLGCFIPILFSKSEYNLSIIYVAYTFFLFSTVLGYFLNYKQTLLSVDQKNYIITGYFQTTGIIKTIIQIAIVYYTRNYYIWIVLELVFSIIYSFVLNWKIRKIYPWLQTDIVDGKNIITKYPEIIKYIKQLFIHKIANFVQNQTTPLLIYAIISLKEVAYYGNYTIIVSKLAFLVNNIFDGSQASVGNLVAEGDNNKIKQVFYEIMSLRYFFSGIFVFSLYNLTEPFISLWLGDEYILNKSILIIMLINTYISQTRGAVDLFINGFGLFSDIWAPCTEAAISLILSLLLGYFWGLEGILLGVTISLIIIVCIWKPILLHKKGFKTSIKYYFKIVSKFLFLLSVSWSLSYVIINLFKEVITHDYITWIIYSILTTSLFGIILFILMYISEKSMRTLVKRFIVYLLKKY